MAENGRFGGQGLKTGRLFQLTAIVALSCSCSTMAPPSLGQAVVVAVAHACIAAVDRVQGQVVIVVPSSLTREYVRALDSVRQTISRRDVPRTEPQVAVPEGYFVVDSFTIQGDVATFSGRFGPVLSTDSNEVVLNCGDGYEWRLTRQSNGDWLAEIVSIYAC